MGRRPSELPEPFALAVADEIRKEMGRNRLSGRALGKLINRSESYIRQRVSNKLEFTLNDIDRLCAQLEIKPEDFIARVDSRLMSGETHSVDDINKFRSAREEQEWIAAEHAVANTDPDDNLEEDRD